MIFNPAIITASGSYQAETLAFLARCSAPQSTARKRAYDNLIKSLKLAGVWSLLDVLQIYAASDSQAALLNLVANSINGTTTNSPTFTIDRGFKGNGSSSYVNTNFLANAGGLNSSLNSSFLGFWEGSGMVGGNQSGAYNGSNGIGLAPQPSSPILTSISSTINSAFATAWNASNLAVPPNGFWSLNRDAAQSLTLYADGVQQATNTAAGIASTALLTTSVRACSLGTTLYDSRRHGAFVYGANMDGTHHAALSAAIWAYMAAVGNVTTPLVGWGDSLSNATWYKGAMTQSDTSDIPARRTISQGNSGETSSQIATRMLADTTYNSYVQVIWAGRNDVNNAAQTVANSTILSNVASMVAAAQARSNKYLVLNVTKANLNAPAGLGYTHSEATGTTIGVALDSLTSSLSAAYGQNFYDINAALVTYGTTSNANDQADAANGLPPRSLMSDYVHYTTAGYAFIGNKIELALEAAGY